MDQTYKRLKCSKQMKNKKTQSHHMFGLRFIKDCHGFVNVEQMNVMINDWVIH